MVMVLHLYSAFPYAVMRLQHFAGDFDQSALSSLQFFLWEGLTERQGRIESPGFRPWPGSLYCILGRETLLSSPRSICQGNLTRCWREGGGNCRRCTDTGFNVIIITNTSTTTTIIILFCYFLSWRFYVTFSFQLFGNYINLQESICYVKYIVIEYLKQRITSSNDYYMFVTFLFVNC